MDEDPVRSPQSGPEEVLSLPVSLVTQTKRPAERASIQALLLALTVVTTIIAGFFLNLQFVSASDQDFSRRLSAVWEHPTVLLAGVPFALTILIILLAHEMGHYLACRFYGIEATLPYVIPAPPPFVPFGTFGAVIKIRSIFRTRKELFDVGIAGPLAGFVCIVPALLLGLWLSNEFSVTGSLEPTLEFGEPLLFQQLVGFFFPRGSQSLNLHPVGWAAWFGMLATSLNLLPVGQLDGGHIVYALVGARGHRLVSYLAFAGLIGVSFLSWPMLGYLFFAVILLVLRLKHPRPLFDHDDLGRGRRILGLVAAVVFLLTFIPIPVRLIEHVGSL